MYTLVDILFSLNEMFAFKKLISVKLHEVVKVKKICWKVLSHISKSIVLAISMIITVPVDVSRNLTLSVYTLSNFEVKPCL